MASRNNAVVHNTEDRSWWYQHGEKLEESFVNVCKDNLKLDICINPEKEKNKTAPDLLHKGKIADLKTQNTPFFMSSKYNVEPRFAVTFNRKDYHRYEKLYPSIEIFFWIDWKQLEYKTRKVEYVGGIFSLPFSDIKSMIENGAPEHHYMFRQNEGNRNAKSSFLFDIRKFNKVFCSVDV
jgi:hypothetical protein